MHGLSQQSALKVISLLQQKKREVGITPEVQVDRLIHIDKIMVPKETKAKFFRHGGPYQIDFVKKHVYMRTKILEKIDREIKKR